MASILLIAPYQGFADVFREVFSNHAETGGGEQTASEEYKLDVIVEYHQEKILAMQPTCDVLVARGFSAEIRSSWGNGVLSAPLLGRFNIANALAALACLLVLGYDLKALLAVASVISPPGQ